MKPVVALVGRPNVGKSALFNRIVQKRVTIVEDTPGVTRDRVYSEAEWSGVEFVLVDTGGFESNARDLSLMVRSQAEAAMREADVIVFVVDSKTGVSPGDHEIAQTIRAGTGKVVLAVNKADNPGDARTWTDFYELGLGEPFPVSAVHGLGVGDLLDRVIELLPEHEKQAEVSELPPINIAIIGRPNVGKSSLVNSLLGEERMIVSDIPGTTRDAVDVDWAPRPGDRFRLVDTAGLRRKGKIDLALERYSASRSLKAVDRSDVVLLMIDATEGVLEQDKKIASYAHREGKAAVILVNKWDLIEDKEQERKKLENVIRYRINFLDYAPIEFISAKTKTKINRIPALVEKVYAAYDRKIGTSDLNRVIQDAVRVSPPPSVNGKQLKVYYGTQVRRTPPAFLFFVNNEKFITDPYKRYIEDRMRQQFDFEGSPIRLVFRSRERE